MNKINFQKLAELGIKAPRIKLWKPALKFKKPSFDFLKFDFLKFKRSKSGKSKPYKGTPAKKKSRFARTTFTEHALSFTRFSVKEQTHFAKRLAFLVNAGVPMVEGLHMLRAQTKGRAKGKIFDKIIDDVSDGQYLSTSLARFRNFFGGFAINIIKIGESGGVLSENLNYLADELRKKYELRKKVIGALVYPIFISIATLLLVGLLTVFIFPKVMPIFQSLGVQLPITTIALLAISNFLRVYGLFVIAGIIVFVIVFLILYRRIPAFHFVIDHIILRLPIVGRLTKYYYTTNFCRTLGLLLKSGTGVVEAASITGDTMASLVYRRECKAIAKRVSSGGRISTHLEKRPQYFPDIIAHMTAVGETSGRLSDTLIYLAELYEAEVDDMTKNLSSSIEPVLMIFLGILVGFVAVSVITPIYEVTQTISNQI